MKTNNHTNPRGINFIVFDLETGGLHEEKNPILEITMLGLKIDKEDLIIDDKDWIVDGMVKPYGDKIIDDKALAVNKITLKDLKKYGNGVEDVLMAIIELVKKMNPKLTDKNKPILIGHNIDNFDILFLENLFKHGKVDMYHYFNKTTIDTLTLAKMIFFNDSKIKSLSLGSMCNYFGITLDDAHQSFNDTYANAQLFIKITKIMKAKRSEILKIK